MRIQHNIMAMSAYRNYTNNVAAMKKNLEKLSSGYKINRAGDDAAGLAVSEKMRAQISALEGAQKNTKDGISFIQTAEGALQEVSDMLNRMYYLTEQAANGIYESVDCKNLNMEVTELKNEIKRIGESANFNNRKLFTAAGMLAGTFKFAIDDLGGNANGFLTLTGFKISTLTTNALGITSVKISTTDATFATHMSNIKDAINKVAAVRGKLGAYQNRLEHTYNNLGVVRENMQDAESVVRDTDVAEEMMKFTKNSILNQSAQAMLAQANQVPQGVLQLLG